jgi:hypothetical protein
MGVVPPACEFLPESFSAPCSGPQTQWPPHMESLSHHRAGQPLQSQQMESLPGVRLNPQAARAPWLPRGVRGRTPHPDAPPGYPGPQRFEATPGSGYRRCPVLHQGLALVSPCGLAAGRVAASPGPDCLRVGEIEAGWPPLRRSFIPPHDFAYLT